MGSRTQNQRRSPNLANSKVLKWITVLFLPFSLAIWTRLPSQDPVGYMIFADQRDFFSIPNAFDVLSNLFFIAAGGYGLGMIWKNRSRWNSIYLFLASVIAIAGLLTFFGSAYFHYAPSIERLFWDRLPIAMGFAGILSLLVLDRIEERLGLIVASLLLPFSVYTVIGWNEGLFTLRPYFVLQYGGLIFILLISMLRPTGKVPNRLIFLSLSLYVIAKLFEVADARVFALTGFVSGHTIKHICAAFALANILTFLKLAPRSSGPLLSPE